ncbi:MAG: hypothetical protein AB8I08_17040 [Sandaracinaceae bacterium]
MDSHRPRFRAYRVEDVACGHGHTLARSADGRLFAWGDGARGQTGLGRTDRTFRPTPVPLP